MEKVDVRGLSCPMPVIRTKKVIDQGAKQLLVIGSSSVSRENVKKLAINSGYQVNLKKNEESNWEMELTK
ncbi:MAG: sulfurtransferase TusA family protein [Syntrophomonadaceae bacterium]|nr:sulfurtransferase TusA family protein [Syntrophomonadaceae bacterium]